MYEEIADIILAEIQKNAINVLNKAKTPTDSQQELLLSVSSGHFLE